MLAKLGLLGLVASGLLLLAGCAGSCGCGVNKCKGCGWQSWCTVSECGKVTCYKATDTQGNVRECRGSCTKYAREIAK